MRKETGNTRQEKETGDRRWEIGDGRWEKGDGRWEAGDVVRGNRGDPPTSKNVRNSRHIIVASINE